MDELLKNTFDNEASHYDETTQYLLLDYDYILNQAVEKIEFPKHGFFNILDLGCGTGNLIQKIRKNFPNATIFALDFSEEMIQIAKDKKITDIHYILANMFDLHNSDLPYFDVVISSFVFHNFHSIDEYRKIFSLVNDYLAVGGEFIIADLIELDDSFQKRQTQKRLVELMRNHNLSNTEIVKWLGILEVEDSPLTISAEIKLLSDTGFEIINTSTYNNNNAVFTAHKKLNIIQLKSELLFSGVQLNDYVKNLYLFQNPQNVWKTGNNGIFISINGLNVLISINHKSNHDSPYKIISDGETIYLVKNGVKLDINIYPMEFPKWFFTKIPELDNKPFSEYFVYEGTGFLHLAYKQCSFSNKEKCKFCSTQRRIDKKKNDVNEICISLSKVLNQIPDNVQICLGGGTYIPLEENVEYFSSIIRCIREKNIKNPIWVEMIPPKLEDINRLINDGATSFGFNIEIWNDDIRREICPGKSKTSKDYYFEACRFVLNKLGPNSVGSCLIVGLDSYDSIKKAIDILVSEGIEPCILPYKSYNKTDLGEFVVRQSYKHDFYRLSEYVSQAAKSNGIIFDQNQGCLKCSCCTIMHDFQSKLL